jgi:hypothetical protein|tara:strand:- start:66 stop:248 length:183 start_codon:yes stop_codon:yes gene_type:complete
MATRTSKRLTRTIPPLRGPNSQVPPVKLNMGSKKEVKVKAGYHKMPDGSIMKNSAHKGKK